MFTFCASWTTMTILCSISNRRESAHETTLPLVTFRLDSSTTMKNLTQMIRTTTSEFPLQLEQLLDVSLIFFVCSQNYFNEIKDSFLKSVTSRLTVAQVVEGVKSGCEMTFDYYMYLLCACTIASMAFMNNDGINLAASMMIEPLMVRGSKVKEFDFSLIYFPGRSDGNLLRTGTLGQGCHSHWAQKSCLWPYILFALWLPLWAALLDLESCLASTS